MRQCTDSSKLPPNNSFKPNLLRYGPGVAEKACHTMSSTTQVGLTQALAAMETFLALLLATAALAAPEPARPINVAPVELPPHTPQDALIVALKVTFVVLPSGATANVRLEQTSGQRSCDRALLETVKRWTYAQRSESLTITEMVGTCTY